jgi:hypothetical protein
VRRPIVVIAEMAALVSTASLGADRLASPAMPIDATAMTAAKPRKRPNMLRLFAA